MMYAPPADYHYISTHPATGHLGPGINISHLLDYIEDIPTTTTPSGNKMMRFITYPGIANCATKVGKDSLIPLIITLRVVDIILNYSGYCVV